MSSKKRDYYDVLGVSKSATENEIKTAYRKMARKYHPDVSKEKDASSKFKEVSEAYSVLSDPNKKQMYDRTGHASADGGGYGGYGAGGFDPNDFGGFGGFEGFGGSGGFEDIFGFSDIFGGGKSRQSRSSEIHGRDISYKISITLEDSFFGKKVNLSYDVPERCSSCDGNGYSGQPINCSSCGGSGMKTSQSGMFRFATTCGSCGGQGRRYEHKCKVCHGEGRINKRKNVTVEVPKGIEDNSNIKIPGMGEGGAKGGRNGDLYVNIKVEPHAIFQKQGHNILVNKTVSLYEVLIGKSIIINGIDGNVEVKIPEGYITNDIIKVVGKGFYKGINSSSRGDLLIQLKITMPKLSTKNKEKFIDFWNNL